VTELDDRYRERLAELRRRVKATVAGLYTSTIDPDNLDASFEQFTPRAAEVVQAGQAGGVSLASGYLAALVLVNASRTADFGAFTGSEVVGATAMGSTLTEGMDAFPSMVKTQIGKGIEVPHAVEYGRFLAERFADNEVTGAVDRHTEIVTSQSGEFSGWAGITVGETCDPCQGNEGFHTLDQSFYRHPGCDCTREYLVA